MVDSIQGGFSKTCYYELLDVDRKADEKTIDRVSQLFKISHYDSSRRIKKLH